MELMDTSETLEQNVMVAHRFCWNIKVILFNNYNIS